MNALKLFYVSQLKTVPRKMQNGIHPIQIDFSQLLL